MVSSISFTISVSSPVAHPWPSLVTIDCHPGLTCFLWSSSSLIVRRSTLIDCQISSLIGVCVLSSARPGLLCTYYSLDSGFSIF
uniref:Uncharacterized protein n=1 Tax=Kalanchoe fedtschenkoi TaxID=63787 RepID=A0A7N0VFR6_KALFE